MMMRNLFLDVNHRETIGVCENGEMGCTVCQNESCASCKAGPHEMCDCLNPWNREPIAPKPAKPETIRFRCPVIDCAALVDSIATVFCESGEYDQARDEYANEGDADVYACAVGHRFAYDPPVAFEAGGA